MGQKRRGNVSLGGERKDSRAVDAWGWRDFSGVKHAQYS